jgi:YHS domain-containing protein
MKTTEGFMSNLSRRSILIALSTVVMAAADRAARAAEAAPPIVGKRLALKGYDPVSYFTEGRPEQGSAEYQAAFDDATYWFKNAEHRAMFVADPDHYAPQFKGYCTIMVSRGVKQEADPEAWAIADGKLYVFSVKQGVPMFEQQTASITEKAAANWPELRKQP